VKGPDHRESPLTVASPDLRGIPSGVSSLAVVPADAAEGVNDFGRRGYGGPCLPRGAAHHYHFVVLALDTRLGGLPERRGRIWSHAFAVTCWAGASWSRPTSAADQADGAAAADCDSAAAPLQRTTIGLFAAHAGEGRPVESPDGVAAWSELITGCTSCSAAGGSLRQPLYRPASRACHGTSPGYRGSTCLDFAAAGGMMDA